MRALRRARSLCPECLRVIDARYVTDREARIVYLEKTCPEHGLFRAPAWVEKNGSPNFAAWQNGPPPGHTPASSAADAKGCPFDCGLCPDHAQRTCCALVEVTRRCDMNCPLCYASSGGNGEDPDLEDVTDMLSTLRRYGGRANVQLSGGEPTVREDLPEIIRLVQAAGFPFVQLNTNGLRLAREADYAPRLKRAGLDLVYLQWDGMSDSTFVRLRGAPYLAAKERAARNCIRAGLPLLLVATLVRGVNDDELGGLLRKALSLGESLRGLHLQPAASFGRHPWAKGRAPAPLTLPELMLALEEQSEGMIRATDFHPPNAEHALCSFSALYQRSGDDRLELVNSKGAEESACCSPRNEARRARDFVARHWGGVTAAPPPEPPATGDAPGLCPEWADPDGRGPAREAEALLAGAPILRRRFTLSAMAFQDVFSLDLERVRRCHIHIVTRDKRLVPFCLYNLDSASGFALHRRDG